MEYAGRPSRLYFAKKMTEDLGGAKIYLKREDLNHTGAHKINNAGTGPSGQADGANPPDRRNGAGQHGVATATAAAPSWGWSAWSLWGRGYRPPGPQCTGCAFWERRWFLLRQARLR